MYIYGGCLIGPDDGIEIERFVDELLRASDCWYIGNGLLETQYARYSFMKQQQ
jgi:hypothetical protein